MKIAIVTATYRKLDGSTYKDLKRALESVRDQTHQDYKMFLIGDDYTDNDELISLSKIIPDDKVYVENLPVAVERIKYSGIDLWCCGGTNASNIGLKKALSEGYDYVCLLNHDDYFAPDHLAVISECIEKTKTNFITTKCGHLPDVIPQELYTRYRPISSHIFLVSVCLNYSYYKILIRNMIETVGESYPGDADMWNRINEFMSKNSEYGIFINKETCYKPTEGSVINNPELIK